MGLNVAFYCRTSKVDRNGMAPVEVSIIVNGDRVILPLPRKERPEDFKKCIESKRNNDIKNYLAAVRINIGKAITEITESGLPLDRNTLKEYVKYGGVRKRSIEEVFNEYMDIIKYKVGVSMGKQQYRKFEIMRDKFFECVDKDKPITAVTTQTIEEFIMHLDMEYNGASVASMCTKLKAVTTYAVDKGYLKANPWTMIKVQKPKPKEEWLSDADLNKVRNIKLNSVELEKARELFLFQCATGISYADLMELDPETDLQQDGNTWYVAKRRTKTGVKFTSVVLPEGVEILKNWGFNIPKKSNQKYNLCLLKIETMAGVSKHLHSHLGRKVYGTTLLRSGVGMKTVSKSLGHSTTQITESTYAFLQSADVVREISTKMCI